MPLTLLAALTILPPPLAILLASLLFMSGALTIQVLFPDKKP